MLDLFADSPDPSPGPSPASKQSQNSQGSSNQVCGQQISQSSSARDKRNEKNNKDHVQIQGLKCNLSQVTKAPEETPKTRLCPDHHIHNLGQKRNFSELTGLSAEEPSSKHLCPDKQGSNTSNTGTAEDMSVGTMGKQNNVGFGSKMPTLNELRLDDSPSKKMGGVMKAAVKGAFSNIIKTKVFHHQHQRQEDDGGDYEDEKSSPDDGGDVDGNASRALPADANALENIQQAKIKELMLRNKLLTSQLDDTIAERESLRAIVREQHERLIVKAVRKAEMQTAAGEDDGDDDGSSGGGSIPRDGKKKKTVGNPVLDLVGGKRHGPLLYCLPAVMAWNARHGMDRSLCWTLSDIQKKFNHLGDQIAALVDICDTVASPKVDPARELEELGGMLGGETFRFILHAAFPFVVRAAVWDKLIEMCFGENDPPVLRRTTWPDLLRSFRAEAEHYHQAHEPYTDLYITRFHFLRHQLAKEYIIHNKDSPLQSLVPIDKGVKESLVTNVMSVVRPYINKPQTYTSVVRTAEGLISDASTLAAFMFLSPHSFPTPVRTYDPTTTAVARNSKKSTIIPIAGGEHGWNLGDRFRLQSQKIAKGWGRHCGNCGTNKATDLIVEPFVTYRGDGYGGGYGVETLLVKGGMVVEIEGTNRGTTGANALTVAEIMDVDNKMGTRMVTEATVAAWEI